jgi:Holliday junction resolvasome RuvABC endonuclease subunit
VNILALDPAVKCGVAHTAGHVLVWRLTDDPKEHPGAKLERLRTLIYRAAREWGIDLIAFENASFGSNNRDTAAGHNKLIGVIELVAKELGVRCLGLNPATLKKHATGHGNAKKPAMIAAARDRLRYDGCDDNEADALWVLDMATKHPGGVETEKAKARRIKRAERKEPRLF